MEYQNTAMKTGLAVLGIVPGAIGGATVSYFLTGVLYLIYAELHPVDPSAECARGGGIAWLSIVGGAVVGVVLFVSAVLKRSE